ncbi:hypothetical protein K439DRAFT_1643902 [Ramaria rubella]|nr:hypothetical protein K439DRAFT_1643902 [Ramaria rubella]
MPLSRPLGDSELSYFLPSRADGVNDMYLHLGFTAPTSLVNSERVALAWAILRGRHPLLASRVLMQPGKYDDVRFDYTPPPSPQHALKDAQDALRTAHSPKDALIDSYLNGPRTLSNDRVSLLILSSPHYAPLTPPASPLAGPQVAPPHSPPSPDFTPDPEREFDLLICAAHFLGDGMALHAFANDFFSLLAAPAAGSPPDANGKGPGTENENGAPLSDTMLHALLEREWHDRWGDTTQTTPTHTLNADAALILPAPLESRLPPARSTLQRIAFDVEFKCAQDRLIGGHSFARAPHASFRHTIVPTVSFDEDTTRRALRTCKAQGVSISHALFALCNIAWARVKSGREELPMMMYSALNLRPYLAPSPSNPSYWFLAVGYFNVGPRLPPPLVALKPDDTPTLARTPPPSAALLGLSLLGNLDATYKHATYPRVVLHTLTTGSRQRVGAMLLFGYTFRGRLWLSLGYDEAGYEEGEGGGGGGCCRGCGEFLAR